MLPHANPSYLSLDSDNDKVLNWQEYHGKWNTNTTFGLNPRSTGSLDPNGTGMSVDWASYWGITYDSAGANADADSDGVKNKDEYAYNINPRMSDTDADGLPDKFEVKYFTSGHIDPSKKNSDGDSNPEKYDGEEDYDNDGLTNLQEYNFDTSLMRLSPIDDNSDNDNHKDKLEYDFYMASGTLKDINNVEISPIVDNGDIRYSQYLMTSVWSQYASYPNDQSGAMAKITSHDHQYWYSQIVSSYGTLVMRSQGLSNYSVPLNLRSHLTSVAVEYHLKVDTSGGTMANLAFKIKRSDGTWQDYVSIDTSPSNPELYDEEKAIDDSSTLENGKYVESIQVAMWADPNLFKCANLQIDQLVVWYIFV